MREAPNQELRGLTVGMSVGRILELQCRQAWAACQSPVPEIWCINSEVQTQVLRLTTPELHPADEDLSAGTPETEKRLGPLSLRMTGHFMLWTLGAGHQGKFLWLAAALRELKIELCTLSVDEHDSVIDELLAGAVVGLIAAQRFQGKEEFD